MTNIFTMKVFQAVIIVLVFLVSCTESNSNKYCYSKPKTTNDGWKTQSLSFSGVSQNKLEILTDEIFKGNFPGINSLVIARNQNLIYEEYFQGKTSTDKFPMYSVTKSISSLLLGKALDQADIDNLNISIHNLMSVNNELLNDDLKQQITLRHILTMTTGLKWNEKGLPRDHSENSHYLMEQSQDWNHFVLSRPLEFNPGSQWVYNTGAVNLIAPIISSIIDQTAAEFAESVCFEPLAISSYNWEMNPSNQICTGGSKGGLFLTARDWVKFGILLQDGSWQGNNVIPEQWIRQLHIPQVTNDQDGNMSLLWWLGAYEIDGIPNSFVAAFGIGGQAIYYFPETDLTIVIISANGNMKKTVVPIVKTILGSVE